MKKLIINPLTKDESPVIRYRHMLDNYEIVAAIPKKGYGFEGKDVCVLDGGEPTGAIFHNPYEDDTPLHDVVLSEIINDKYVTPTYEVLPTEILKKLHVPVIVVMGNGPECQKFDIQLGLRDTFLMEGYKVLQFGTKSYSKLFGFDPLPDFSEFPLWRKVFYYNNLLYEKCLTENPDVVIIGVPGGVMPINDFSNEKFGEEALAISFAAKPDYAIFSWYFTFPTLKYFDTYNNFMRFRLGINNVLYHMSNTKITPNVNLNSVDYLTLESKFVLEEIIRKVPEFSSKLFNTLLSESAKPAYMGLVKKLQDNVFVL
jgi:peptide maturation system protein (TIGR04066 family)